MDKAQILEKARKYLTLNDFSEHTIKMYLFYLEKYFNFLENQNHQLDQYKKDIVIDYFVYLKEKGLTAKSRSLIKTILLYLYRDIYSISNVKEDLKIIRIKQQRRIVLSLNHEKVKEIIEIVENPTHKLIIKILYNCGLRVSEVSHLTIMGVKTKKIIGKGNKEREIYLNPELQKEILSHHVKYGDGEKIFNNYNERLIQKIVRVNADKLNLKWVTPHTFRKSFTTNMLNLGYDLEEVASWLGHDDINITRKHYIGKREHKDRGDLYF